MSLKRLAFLEHHFGRFDDHGNLVALLKTEFFGAATGNHALDLVLSDSDDNVGHDVPERHFHHLPFELVPR